jgi:hypothetical protein
MATPKRDWHFRDLNLPFRKPKPRPALKGDARVEAWNAAAVETRRALATFRSMAGIRRDGAAPSWKELRTATAATRAAFGRRIEKQR